MYKYVISSKEIKLRTNFAVSDLKYELISNLRGLILIFNYKAKPRFENNRHKHFNTLLIRIVLNLF